MDFLGINKYCGSCTVVTGVRQSPTKRRAMFGAAALVATAAVSRKKSSTLSPTPETGELRQPSVHVDRPMTAGLGVCLFCCQCCLSFLLLLCMCTDTLLEWTLLVDTGLASCLIYFSALLVLKETL